VGSAKLVWALVPIAAVWVAGCGRKTEDARPEPVTLSREVPRRPGFEHGQDPRRASDAPAPASARESQDAAEVYEPEQASKPADDDVDDVRSRKSAKHRGEGRKRAGGVADAHDDKPTASVALRAKRLIVARKIEGREPVGIARSFDGSSVGQVAAFVELTNDAREETRIVVRFEPPSSSPFEVALDVGASPRWRTWATTKRPLEEGTWRVRVLDDDGALVAETSFEVTE